MPKIEKKKNNFGKGPWILKKGDIDNFRQVTQENRKMAIVKGRILYVIENIGPAFMFRGTMTIDPCFIRGKFKYPLKPWQQNYPGHVQVFFDQDMNYQEWVNTNKVMIDGYIEKGYLYIRPEDPILTYFKI